MPVKNYYSGNGQIRMQRSTGDVRSTLLFPDALGNVSAVRPADSTDVKTVSYTPYGLGLNPYSRVGWVGTWGYRTNPYRRTPSHYVRARHFDNRTGSWTTRDPLWPGEQPWAYGHCSPMTRTDPSGLQIQGIVGAVTELCNPRAKKWEIQELKNPCASGSNAGCPNQKGTGRVDITAFSRRGDANQIDICEPSTVNLEALNQRLQEVEGQVSKLCNPGTGQTGQGLGYQFWAETKPCIVYDPALKYLKVSCQTQCVDLKEKIAAAYFGRGLKSTMGIGCIACCLLVHENHHCNQIILGMRPIKEGRVRMTDEERAKAECEAWRKELACLQRVKAGMKCTS